MHFFLTTSVAWAGSSVGENGRSGPTGGSAAVVLFAVCGGQCSGPAQHSEQAQHGRFNAGAGAQERPALLPSSVCSRHCRCCRGFVSLMRYTVTLPHKLSLSLSLPSVFVCVCVSQVALTGSFVSTLGSSDLGAQRAVLNIVTSISSSALVEAKAASVSVMCLCCLRASHPQTPLLLGQALLSSITPVVFSMLACLLSN